MASNQTSVFPSKKITASKDSEVTSTPVADEGNRKNGALPSRAQASGRSSGTISCPQKLSLKKNSIVTGSNNGLVRGVGTGKGRNVTMNSTINGPGSARTLKSNSSGVTIRKTVQQINQTINGLPEPGGSKSSEVDDHNQHDQAGSDTESQYQLKESSETTSVNDDGNVHGEILESNPTDTDNYNIVNKTNNVVCEKTDQIDQPSIVDQPSIETTITTETGYKPPSPSLPLSKRFNGPMSFKKSTEKINMDKISRHHSTNNNIPPLNTTPLSLICNPNCSGLHFCLQKIPEGILQCSVVAGNSAGNSTQANTTQVAENSNPKIKLDGGLRKAMNEVVSIRTVANNSEICTLEDYKTIAAYETLLLKLYANTNLKKESDELF